MKYKLSFCSRVIKEYPETETARLLERNVDCGYYELCQSFLDVALNAPTVRTEDGSLAGIFQHTDIAVAKDNAVEFIKNNDVADLDNFFEVLGRQYPSSARPDDKRQKSGIDRVNGGERYGYMGMWYHFNHIPSDIFDGIISEIKDMLAE